MRLFWRSCSENSKLTSKLQTLARFLALLPPEELKLYSIYEGTSRQVTFSALLVFFCFAPLNDFYTVVFQRFLMQLPAIRQNLFNIKFFGKSSSK